MSYNGGGLNFDQVGIPTFAGTSEGMRSAFATLSNAMKNAGGLGVSVGKKFEEDELKNLIGNIHKYGTGDALQKARADGSLFDGVAKQYLTPESLEKVNRTYIPEQYAMDKSVGDLAKNKADIGLVEANTGLARANAGKVRQDTRIAGYKHNRDVNSLAFERAVRDATEGMSPMQRNEWLNSGGLGDLERRFGVGFKDVNNAVSNANNMFGLSNSAIGSQTALDSYVANKKANEIKDMLVGGGYTNEEDLYRDIAPRWKDLPLEAKESLAKEFPKLAGLNGTIEEALTKGDVRSADLIARQFVGPNQPDGYGAVEQQVAQPQEVKADPFTEIASNLLSNTASEKAKGSPLDDFGSIVQGAIKNSDSYISQNVDQDLTESAPEINQSLADLGFREGVTTGSDILKEKGKTLESRDYATMMSNGYSPNSVPENPIYQYIDEGAFEKAGISMDKPLTSADMTNLLKAGMSKKNAPLYAERYEKAKVNEAKQAERVEAEDRKKSLPYMESAKEYLSGIAEFNAQDPLTQQKLIEKMAVEMSNNEEAERAKKAEQREAYNNRPREQVIQDNTTNLVTRASNPENAKSVLSGINNSINTVANNIKTSEEERKIPNDIPSVSKYYGVDKDNIAKFAENIPKVMNSSELGFSVSAKQAGKALSLTGGNVSKAVDLIKANSDKLSKSQVNEEVLYDRYASLSKQAETFSAEYLNNANALKALEAQYNQTSSPIVKNEIRRLMEEKAEALRSASEVLATIQYDIEELNKNINTF